MYLKAFSKIYFCFRQLANNSWNFYFIKNLSPTYLYRYMLISYNVFRKWEIDLLFGRTKIQLKRPKYTIISPH